MTTLAPESNRVIRLPNAYLEGRDAVIFYEGVRQLEKRLQILEMGLDETTPYDKFFILVAREIWKNGFLGGTHGTPPPDVVAILDKLFTKYIK